ncbi:hypothetical protein BCR34DRAFT_551518 [Clohesyomyces aquaticus]|uniref:Uncharacterized protein n=1 Tax=Clohesyomyces aquaticus TaxID=1231657 RepID=A0A1Y2AAZ5_9PLEO|nr:hypothetical protein BCR34DRAFT_551518 [Clohesyomyces aquaticus]
MTAELEEEVKELGVKGKKDGYFRSGRSKKTKNGKKNADAEGQKPAKAIRISATAKKALFKYWREVTTDFEGQYHRPHDLSKMLDPFRGTEVIHKEAIKTYVRAMLQPMPAGSGDFLDPDPGLANEYPYNEEPWASTLIRTFCHNKGEKEGRDKPVNRVGQMLERHVKRLEENIDENGNWVKDSPVKRILWHSYNRNAQGEIEYEFQFLVYEQPRENIWQGREALGRRHHIWEQSDAEHGIVR